MLNKLINQIIIICIFIFVLCISGFSESSDEIDYQDVYNMLMDEVETDSDLLALIKGQYGANDYTDAQELEFEGNVRYLHPPDDVEDDDFQKGLYILRKADGTVYILDLPDKSKWDEDSDSFYAGLTEMYENKLNFKIVSKEVVVGESIFLYAKFTAAPYQGIFNKIFRLSIIGFLFLIMLGMGMTLTLNDFKRIIKNPRALIIGPILSFGLIPLIAYVLCMLLIDEAFPYVYAGIILIACSPGGVISNLMTYYAKGDLALSVSMTATTTILCLFFTPLMLKTFATDLPDVDVPTLDIFVTILFLVLIPLSGGMVIRYFAEKFAKKTEKFFSGLGLIALLFIIIFGVIDNIDVFKRTDMYNFKFYLTIFLLLILSMTFAIAIAKLFRISNYQTRAMSVEVGFRNATLSMAIALLIQDKMGDFYSSMFTACGAYGLMMYPVGFAMILIFRKLLPVRLADEKDNLSASSEAAAK